MSAFEGFLTERRIIQPRSEPGFEHGVEQTALSGPGLQLLNPSPRDRYQHRFHDVDGSVSELFQANARWRLSDVRAAPDREEQRQLRSWFLSSGRRYSTRADADSAVHRRLDQLPPQLAHGLSGLANVGSDSGLLYGCDLVVLAEGWTWLLPAGGDRMVRMRRLDERKVSRLQEAIHREDRLAFTRADVVISVTTVPWRWEIMHGPRGYRTALQQSGLLLGAVMQTLTEARLTPTAATEFADVAIDEVLDQDGVERFSTALVAVELSAEASSDQDSEEQERPNDHHE